MQTNQFRKIRNVMTEHEEYKNADVPVDIWIQRNEYLHNHYCTT